MGLRTILNYLWDKYKLPMFITENGSSAIEGLVESEDRNMTINDDYRIDLISDHLNQINEAIKDGVNVFGYTTWSAIDFVSGTTATMLKRWGLYMLTTSKTEAEVWKDTRKRVLIGIKK